MREYLAWMVVFILGINTLSKAQNTELAPEMLQKLTASGYDNYYMQYNNSPYFTKDWCESDITITSGEVYKKIKTKYDVYKGHIVYYNPVLKKQLIIDNEIIESVAFQIPEEERTYHLINYCITDSLNKPKCHFYFNLVNDSIALWSKHDKRINVYTDINPGYGKLGEYFSRIRYYLVVNGQFTSLPKNKRKLMKIYPENKKDLALYVRKQGLSYKNEEHLMLIIQKLNELQSN